MSFGKSIEPQEQRRRPSDDCRSACSGFTAEVSNANFGGFHQEQRSQKNHSQGC